MRQSPVVLAAVLMLVGGILTCGVAGWRLIGETLMTTGIDALFGQVYLARESAPVSAREYVSNEVLLGSLRRSNEAEARLVVLPEKAYFWDPAYVGFAQTVLTDDEVAKVLTAMNASPTFIDPSAGQILCIERSGVAEAVRAPCAAGAVWQQIHDETRMSASLNPGMAVLQLRFPDGRLAEFRMYQANGVLAYLTVELNEAAVQGLLSSEKDLIDRLAARAVIPPTAVLWPEQTAEWANARAARRLGRHYRQALDFLWSLEALRQMVGEVEEVRPAAGEGGNWSSAWMDASSLQLLLRVTGDRGEGVVRMRGWECWEAEMMAEGRLVDLTSGFVCPET